MSFLPGKRSKNKDQFLHSTVEKTVLEKLQDNKTLKATEIGKLFRRFFEDWTTEMLTGFESLTGFDKVLLA